MRKAYGKLKKRKKKKEEFNDLLIPILLVLCALPFVIRLAEYSCGYGQYPWYAEEDTILDLYGYGRSIFFEVLTLFTVVVLGFHLFLYPEKRKDSRIFLPLGLYGCAAVCATIFSVNPKASLWGNFYQFQGIFVLLGYLIFAFYTYQILQHERDYRVLWYGLAASSAVLFAVGCFQMFKLDLLDLSWVQRLIMSAEQFDFYGGTMETVFSGNNVFLTLYNPNYAGVFLTMVDSVFFVLCLSEPECKKRLWYGLGLAVGLVLLWFTYSRSVFLSLAAALAAFLWMERKRGRLILKVLLPGLAVMIAGGLLLDYWNDFHFLSRLIDEKKVTQLEAIETAEDGVLLHYGGEVYHISMEEGRPLVRQEGKAGEIRPFAPIQMEVWEEAGLEWLSVAVEGYTFYFGRQENGYFYLTENGKVEQMVKIPHLDFGGLEYLGSGRLYIWSRVLPMLPQYILVGSGPDTFAEVFPQNDYAGKAVYAETTTRIMEKPHNDYLLQWVQNGLAGMLGMVLFYMVYLKQCFAVYGRTKKERFSQRLGYGCFLGCICYMAGSFFNDSTLYTTPLFWVFVGISLAAGREQ